MNKPNRAWEERVAFIVKCRKTKMSYTEIGKLLNLTRQRVHQIFKKTDFYKNKKLYLPENIKNLLGNTNITKATGIGYGSRDRIRELVRIRDNHTCQICSRVWKVGTRRFDVHHEDEEFEGRDRYYKKFRKSGYSIPTEDRNNINRMTTLCHKCHLNLDSVRRKMGATALRGKENPYFKTKRNNAILSRRKRGETFAQIGKRFSITGERARQVCGVGQTKMVAGKIN